MSAHPSIWPVWVFAFLCAAAVPAATAMFGGMLHDRLAPEGGQIAAAPAQTTSCLDSESCGTRYPGLRLVRAVER